MSGYKNIDIEAGIKTRFKKGVSGHGTGKSRKIPEINRLLAEVLGEEKDGITAAQTILMALRARAMKPGGDRAAEILLDRAYGKAKQAMELTGADGEALNFTVTLKL